MRYVLYSFILLLGLSIKGNAQQFLTGKVYVKGSSDTLISVSIHNITTQRYDLSDEDGTYRIQASPGDHIAFSSAQVDLQLWLQHSGKPVPRKIVINYRTDPGSPEYVAVLSDWKFPSSIPASMFRPQLPKTAKHIDILKVKEAKP